jgi:hypothetical protein
MTVYYISVRNWFSLIGRSSIFLIYRTRSQALLVFLVLLGLRMAVGNESPSLGRTGHGIGEL